MRVCANGPGAVKEECCDLTEGSESSDMAPARGHDMSGPCCQHGLGLAGHTSRTWGTCMWCATRNSFVWLTPRTRSGTRTWHERVVLPAWSMTGRTHVQDMGDVHVVRYSQWFGD
jgi:hypothetical protein